MPGMLLSSKKSKGILYLSAKFNSFMRELKLSGQLRPKKINNYDPFSNKNWSFSVTKFFSHQANKENHYQEIDPDSKISQEKIKVVKEDLLPDNAKCKNRHN